MHGPGRAGLLHRRAGSSMDCFADVAIARMESGWALNATDLLGISANPGEMGEWYVLTPGEQGGRRAFRIDANAAGLRLHPPRLPPAARRSTRTSCHWTTRRGRRRLGPGSRAGAQRNLHAPGVRLSRHGRRALLRTGTRHPQHSVGAGDSGHGTRRRSAARQARSGQQLGKIDALLLTSDIVMRGIASDLARERPFPRPVRPGFTAWP